LFFHRIGRWGLDDGDDHLYSADGGEVNELWGGDGTDTAEVDIWDTYAEDIENVMLGE
jgi:hypothetical protein